MDQNEAIAEVDWYCNLVRRRIERWGGMLTPKARALLMENMEGVAECKPSLHFKAEKEGYYIGEVDEEGMRQGYGIYTRTTQKRDRWTMQAGFWHEERAMGVHTFYDSDCPEVHHYLAAIRFRGKRRERGMVELTLSERGIDTRPRKYRRWEGFSFSTLLVGGLIVYIFLLATIRNARISLIIVGFVAALYFLGSLRGRD